MADYGNTKAWEGKDKSRVVGGIPFNYKPRETIMFVKCKVCGAKKQYKTKNPHPCIEKTHRWRYDYEKPV